MKIHERRTAAYVDIYGDTAARYCYDICSAARACAEKSRNPAGIYVPGGVIWFAMLYYTGIYTCGVEAWRSANYTMHEEHMAYAVMLFICYERYI